MNSNKNRRQEIFENVIPPKGTKEYNELTESLKKAETPAVREFMKKSIEKVKLSLEAQYLSSCEFITEHSLREYLTEFNNRAWNHGLRSMPIMFNIMEAFFNYRKPEIYFELIEEENYLISFFDFVDFITSKDFETNKEFIEDNLTPDIIYNFNVGKDLYEISFRTDEGDEFVVAGISIIRRNNEVTILATTGKLKTHELNYPTDFEAVTSNNPDKEAIYTEMATAAAAGEIEYEYLDEEKKYIKVLVCARIDLDSMTVDATYVAEETTRSFKVTTDEVDGFLNSSGDFSSERYKEIYESSRKSISKYSPIVEVIKLSLYLPYYFNLNEEDIVEETHDTNFKTKYSNPVLKRKYKNTYGQKLATKNLYLLDRDNIFSPNKITVRDDLFNVQSSGYWKQLPVDEIGMDKKGNPIHGKTWVTQTLSWFEAKESTLVVKKDTVEYTGKNAGQIYIVRNAAMAKDVYKIGLTRNEVDDRINQLSSTSVPDKFLKVQEWSVKDCVLAEKLIHQKLQTYRVDPRREFFRVDYDVAASVVKAVVRDINSK